MLWNPQDTPSNKPLRSRLVPEPAFATSAHDVANRRIEPITVGTRTGELTFGREALARLVHDLVAPRLH